MSQQKWKLEVIPPAVGRLANEDVAQQLMMVDTLILEHDPLAVPHDDDLVTGR
jgi:hypothetical protein